MERYIQYDIPTHSDRLVFGSANTRRARRQRRFAVSRGVPRSGGLIVRPREGGPFRRASKAVLSRKALWQISSISWLPQFEASPDIRNAELAARLSTDTG